MPLMLDGAMDTNMETGMDDGMAAPMQVDHLDVDDLFGDGVALALRSIRAPSKHLYQRVDELRTRGCCQYDSSHLFYPLGCLSTSLTNSTEPWLGPSLEQLHP